MKLLIIPYGWMGDTLFATSAARILKKLNPLYKVDFYLNHPPMIDFISNIPDIDDVVYSSEGYDRVFIMPHTNIFENPIETYISSIDSNIKHPIFEPIPNIPSSTSNYITYQSDWQNRTKLNVSFIINELNKYIECVPIGKNTSITIGSREENKLLFNKTVIHLSNSKLHLGMLGGTNVLSSYLGIPTYTTLDHHYLHHHNSLSSDEFYKQIKIIPSVWCQNEKHIEFHPDVDENDIISLILSKIKI